MFAKNVFRVKTIAAAVALGSFAGWAGAAVINPNTGSATIAVGESVTFNKTITVDAGGASKVDVFFLADNTGSMGSILDKIKSQATSILGTLSTTYADAAFGVGRYLGDPVESGETYNTAYQLQQAVTTNQANAVTAINGWYASGGNDTPEGNFYALQQVATEGANVPGTPLTPVKGPNTGSGDVTGWRTGAQRVVTWFGDAPSHNETITEAQTIAALQASGVTVVGMNSAAVNGGIDGSYTSANGTDSTQAADIASATGGSVLNNVTSLSNTQLADAVIAAIGMATSEIDLVFNVSELFPGLGVSFACTDVLGCNDVAGGETRSFSVTFTGLAAGIYAFNTFANGVDAFEHDTITVGSAVPEPGSMALLGLALGAIPLVRRRRV
ncbi:MAG: hypothetical protein CRU78_08260 [Candidatus Accumulibacter phosphatis]|uniref:VWFA domain-containing protein n=1 Tax=Candidatus Accumulibacter phosphatis TaxID=327160 RepID=A0A6A7RTU7_9PROT|nr:hypothetical protein [Candidatus Accumulibacter phosphatis]